LQSHTNAFAAFGVNASVFNGAAEATSFPREPGRLNAGGATNQVRSGNKSQDRECPRTPALLARADEVIEQT